MIDFIIANIALIAAGLALLVYGVSRGVCLLLDLIENRQDSKIEAERERKRKERKEFEDHVRTMTLDEFEFFGSLGAVDIATTWRKLHPPISLKKEPAAPPPEPAPEPVPHPKASDLEEQVYRLHRQTEAMALRARHDREKLLKARAQCEDFINTQEILCGDIRALAGVVNWLRPQDGRLDDRMPERIRKYFDTPESFDEMLSNVLQVPPVDVQKPKPPVAGMKSMNDYIAELKMYREGHGGRPPTPWERMEIENG